jgi:hypothetical protein
MSAAIKYRLEAYSHKYNDVYRVDILEEGYTGAIQRKNIGAGRLRMEKRPGVIQLTSLIISIQADTNFEYLGFFQNNNRKYPVKLYKNDTQIWSGYLVAESYSEPYINPPYDITIVATDGLGLLENYTFENDGIQSRLQAIKHCIDNLGLVLDYSIAVDFYEDSMNTARAMLDEAKFYGEIYNGEKCSDVIKGLLPFGATITQHQNRWLIRRPFDDAEKTHLIYTSGGLYSTTASGETLLSMGDVANGGVWPHGSPLLTMEHAWKEAIIKKVYGKNTSFLKNSNFSNDESYWTDLSDDNLKIKTLNNLYYAQIVGYSAPGSNLYIEQAINVISSGETGGNFIFEIKYDAIGAQSATTLAAGSGINLTVEMMVKLVGASKTYYLTKTGWTETESKISEDIVSSVGSPNWHDLKIITNDIPIDGTLTVRLYRIEESTSGSARTRTRINGSVFSDIRVYTTAIEDYTDPEEIEVSILEDAAQSNNELELKPVDIPDVANAELMFENGNFTHDGVNYSPARFWSDNGGDAVLIEAALASKLLNYYGKPRQKISGCVWRGAGLHLNAIAEHAENYDRVFVADSGSWEIIDDVLNIIWIEKPGSGSGAGTPWILDDAIWGDSGEIWKDTSTWEDTDI